MNDLNTLLQEQTKESDLRVFTYRMINRKVIEKEAAISAIANFLCNNELTEEYEDSLCEIIADVELDLFLKTPNI